MTESAENIALAHRILGQAFATSLTHDTEDDEIARAFDLVCQTMTKRMKAAETVDSFLGLDIANPWRKIDDAPGFRRPVHQRPKQL
jgi:hypothetical protein